MENKIIEVKLIKKEDEYLLHFKLDKEYDLDFASENQDDLKNLFYELVSYLDKYKIDFHFNYNHDEISESNYIVELSTEYLNQLGKEIEDIQSNMPEF